MRAFRAKHNTFWRYISEIIQFRQLKIRACASSKHFFMSQYNNIRELFFCLLQKDKTHTVFDNEVLYIIDIYIYGYDSKKMTNQHVSLVLCVYFLPDVSTRVLLHAAHDTEIKKKKKKKLTVSNTDVLRRWYYFYFCIHTSDILSFRVLYFICGRTNFFFFSCAKKARPRYKNVFGWAWKLLWA